MFINYVLQAEYGYFIRRTLGSSFAVGSHRDIHTR